MEEIQTESMQNIEKERKVKDGWNSLCGFISRCEGSKDPMIFSKYCEKSGEIYCPYIGVRSGMIEFIGEEK